MRENGPVYTPIDKLTEADRKRFVWTHPECGYSECRAVRISTSPAAYIDSVKRNPHFHRCKGCGKGLLFSDWTVYLAEPERRP